MSRSLDLRRVFGGLLILIGVALPLIYFTSAANSQPDRPTPTSTATRVPERLIPTLTATPRSATSNSTTDVTPTSASATPTRVSATQRPTNKAPTSTAVPSPTPTAAVHPTQPPVSGGLYTTRARFGIGVPLPAPYIQRLLDLKAGWFLDWGLSATSGWPAGLDYVRIVSVPRGQIQIDLKTLANLAKRQPGAVWLIGNEPDVIWQNNATPEQYVQAYHTAYTTLKAADPTSRIAIGGVTQPTPLRLQYLDRILTLYREQFGTDMPIDVWNVHNFILPEKRGDWGAEIPPGLDVTSGVDRTIEQHDDLALFKQQIIDFRRWLAERGFRDKELIVSEYGVLMYADLGFPYERVRDFMTGTFDFMLTATDPTLGLPADGNRLVQRWCWYSLSDSTSYPTGNLVDPTTGQLTPLGQDFAAYLQSH